MPLTTLWGWSEADLLKELKKAQKALLQAGDLISAGAGDVNTQRQIQKTAEQRINLIQRSLYELDSTKYADFATVGHSQTIASFR